MMSPSLNGPQINRIPVVTKPTKWRYAVQFHRAKRSGPHLDLRIGERSNAHSWALKYWPSVGEKRLAIQQPTHTIMYMSFSGTLTKGHGAGTVRVTDHGDISVESATNSKIKFSISNGPKKGRYLMFRTQGTKWIISKLS